MAFLDSDDVWEIDHLAIATSALEAGFDFYFSDYTWPSRSSTRFTQANLLADGTPIDSPHEVYSINLDFF
jgi:hypothetical protein